MKNKLLRRLVPICCSALLCIFCANIATLPAYAGFKGPENGEKILAPKTPSPGNQHPNGDTQPPPPGGGSNPGGPPPPGGGNPNGSFPPGGNNPPGHEIIKPLEPFPRQFEHRPDYGTGPVINYHVWPDAQTYKNSYYNLTMTFHGYYRGSLFSEFLKVADDIIDIQYQGSLIYYYFSDYLVIVDGQDRIRCIIFREWNDIEAGQTYSQVCFRYPGGIYKELESPSGSYVLKYQNSSGRILWVWFNEGKVGFIGLGDVIIP